MQRLTTKRNKNLYQRFFCKQGLKNLLQRKCLRLLLPYCNVTSGKLNCSILETVMFTALDKNFTICELHQVGDISDRKEKTS